MLSSLVLVLSMVFSRSTECCFCSVCFSLSHSLLHLSMALSCSCLALCVSSSFTNPAHHKQRHPVTNNSIESEQRHPVTNLHWIRTMTSNQNYEIESQTTAFTSKLFGTLWIHKDTILNIDPPSLISLLIADNSFDRIISINCIHLFDRTLAGLISQWIHTRYNLYFRQENLVIFMICFFQIKPLCINWI